MRVSFRPQLHVLEDRLPPGALVTGGWPSLFWDDPLAQSPGLAARLKDDPWNDLSFRDRLLGQDGPEAVAARPALRLEDSGIGRASSESVPSSILSAHTGAEDPLAVGWISNPSLWVGRIGNPSYGQHELGEFQRAGAVLADTSQAVVTVRELTTAASPTPVPTRATPRPLELPQLQPVQAVELTGPTSGLQATVTKADMQLTPSEDVQFTTLPCGSGTAGPDGLQFSTFMGRNRLDEGAAITVAKSGNFYTVGTMTRTDGSGITDAFVTKVDLENQCTTTLFRQGNNSLIGTDIEAGDDPCLGPGCPPFVWVSITNNNGQVQVVCINDEGKDPPVILDLSNELGYLTAEGITEDPITHDIYVTGWLFYYTGGWDSWLVKLDSSFKFAYGATIHFTLGGVDINTGGNKIAVDTVEDEDNAYIAATAETPFGTELANEPLLFRLSYYDGEVHVVWSSIYRMPTRGSDPSARMFDVRVDGLSVFAIGSLADGAMGQPGQLDHLEVHRSVTGATYWAWVHYLKNGSDYVGTAIGVDAAGNTFTTGWVSNPAPSPNPTYDVHITKYDPNGMFVDWVQLGGQTTPDVGYGLALVRQEGLYAGIYLTGYTESEDFPLVNPCQPRYALNRDAFITRSPLF